MVVVSILDYNIGVDTRCDRGETERRQYYVCNRLDIEDDLGQGIMVFGMRKPKEYHDLTS